MKKNIIIGCLGALLLALGVLYMHSRQNDKARIHELEAKVVVLQKQGETSELDRSVSEQMEDIAHGQQALSEERSQEAIRQSEIAEAERQHALRSQAAAETSAKEAMHSYQVAQTGGRHAELYLIGPNTWITVILHLSDR